ncbi:MAG: DUF1761 domain-containing protein [Candidatus Eremiobacteraeota bacterium]|nr:DUF1761 domain-containing protein [Candidatus Eremiobacteraeota bacterium]MBV8645670.1 DUF1761 domain-containing protein [Candidatus Eremiobacteraeota bacterium]
MTVGKINHLAVIVAAVVYYAWGALWFTVWGNQWQAYAGVTPGHVTATPFIVSFLMGLVLAYVIGIALADSTKPNMLQHGVSFGVFMSVGIWLTQLLSVELYEQKPLGLWLIDGFYVVIGMAIMGAIIGAWRKRA